MEATIKFNLPEDQVEFETAINAGKWKSVAWDMDQWLRKQTKYASDEMSEDTYNAFIECRDTLREIVFENNVNLD